MTGTSDGPDPGRDDAGHGRGQKVSGTENAAEAPDTSSPVGAAGFGLSRPWQQVPWVVIDVEGNGQRPPDLVEAACLPIDGGVPGRVRTWLVRPPRPITGPVRRIHGIGNADVATAPTTADVADQIRAQLAGRVVIGHHVHVDLAVLGRELDGWTAPAALDTLRLAKAAWPGRPSYSLDNLTSAVDPLTHPPALPPSAASALPPTVHGRHRAGYDVTLTAALFLALARTVTETDQASRPGRTSTGGPPSAARLLGLADALPVGTPPAGARPADVHDDSARLF